MSVCTGLSEASLLTYVIGSKISCTQGWHRLEKYLNIQDCLEKSLKIKFALKST